jgi:hypothetical protein
MTNDSMPRINNHQQMEGDNTRLSDENAELKRTIERMNLDCSCE